jgi:hypothetical protein
MESALNCTDGATLLYNPGAVKPGFAAEVGVARLEYSYEHQDFDPVVVSLWTPVASASWVDRLINDQLSIGFSIMPSSAADLKLKGLPRRIEGSQQSMNIKASKHQLHLALGGSFSIPSSGATIGLTLLYTYDQRTLTGDPISDPGARLVDLKAHGHFFRPLTGFVWTNGTYSVGSSYMFPLVKKFSGKTKLAIEPEPFHTAQVDYDPSVWMNSVAVSIDGVSLSINANRIFAKAGRSIHRDGLNLRTQQTDLRDVNHVGARVSIDTGTYGSWALGVAHLDSYWGSGYFFKDEDGIPQHQIGHVFGQFNAIPVRNQALYWSNSFGAWHMETAIFRSAGTTTVGPGGDNPGYYQLEFVSLTSGIKRIL